MLASTSQNLTVLAPLDSEIKHLPRKPWEDPSDYDKLGAEAYEGQSGVDRAQKNLKRFVEAHVVGTSPWAEGEKVQRLSGEGGEVWWEMKDGKQVVSVDICYTSRLFEANRRRQIQPGNIEVVQVADKVSNGEVWVVKGVLNYAI